MSFDLLSFPRLDSQMMRDCEPQDSQILVQDQLSFYGILVIMKERGINIKNL
jgi:hypothetical protein